MVSSSKKQRDETRYSSEPESEERIDMKGKEKQLLLMSNVLGLADLSSESSEEERSGLTKKMDKKKQRGTSKVLNNSSN